MKFAILTRDFALYEAVRNSFEVDGACHHFTDAEQYAAAALSASYCAILVDASLGPGDMQRVLARRRGGRSEGVPVISMATPAWMLDFAFRSGCDDVVMYPLDVNELHVRLSLAMQRRASATAARSSDILEIGAYVVDRGRDTVTVQGVEVVLTAREFAVAWLFFSQPEVRISRQEIAGAIWANDEGVVGRSIEQHVYKLRNRLGLRGDHGLTLRTVYGGGYTLERQGQRVEPAQRNTGSFAPA
ncbi:winged helix-turn-helix transcriptional regulator [Pandoraea anhela]|uniref:Transcriptional regulatory protein QseB n=1 Tax=Pandoraea anhela TaxID=2508295 RepID=A0A5E4RSM9_9BURK|nr:response regulator transcription factor [Pandoraea anhela]VVD66440.1 Transcriptional regulatory protein QseB [Pandoraea anhela]